MDTKGQCEFCHKSDTELSAELTADPDQRVCAECHADPRLPTTDAAEVVRVVDEVATPPAVVASFLTVPEAETYISRLPDVAKVERGGYGIDAPGEENAYSDRFEAIAKKYAPRALALLGRIATVCVEDGLFVKVEPYDFSTDNYEYRVVISRTELGEDDDLVDIAIEITEQREHDGDGDGLNFGLEITEYGGRSLGRLSPFNYTPDVWVDSSDEQAIEDRWNILENADIIEIPDLVRGE